MEYMEGDALKAFGLPHTDHQGEHTIELDAPPGATRPWDLIEGVIKGTGLKVRGEQHAFFGMTVWAWPDVPCAEWIRIQQIIKPRIEALYHRGAIRWGSW